MHLCYVCMSILHTFALGFSTTKVKIEFLSLIWLHLYAVLPIGILEFYPLHNQTPMDTHTHTHTKWAIFKFAYACVAYRRTCNPISYFFPTASSRKNEVWKKETKKFRFWLSSNGNTQKALYTYSPAYREYIHEYVCMQKKSGYLAVKVLELQCNPQQAAGGEQRAGATTVNTSWPEGYAALLNCYCIWVCCLWLQYFDKKNNNNNKTKLNIVVVIITTFFLRCF